MQNHWRSNTEALVMTHIVQLCRERRCTIADACHTSLLDVREHVSQWSVQLLTLYFDVYGHRRIVLYLYTGTAEVDVHFV